MSFQNPHFQLKNIQNRYFSKTFKAVLIQLLILFYLSCLFSFRGLLYTVQFSLVPVFRYPQPFHSSSSDIFCLYQSLPKISSFLIPVFIFNPAYFSNTQYLKRFFPWYSNSFFAIYST